MEFRRQASSRTTERVVVGFIRWTPFFRAPLAERVARTLLPSIHHKSQSMRPTASRSSRRRLRIRTNVPSARHLVNRPCTPVNCPYRRGRSLHGAPVLRIHSMPLKYFRWSFQGRPRPPGFGKRSSMRCHCASVSSCRPATAPRNGDLSPRLSPGSARNCDKANYWTVPSPL